GIRGVRLVASGTIPPNPTELLSSPRLGSLLEEASSAADIVLVDSPPALAVADATIMAPLFDGILMVADTAKTKSRPFARALEAFAQVNGRVIGAVLNKYRAGRFRALYDYGYGYGYAYGYGRSGNGGARAKGRRAAAALRSLSRLGRRAGKTVLR
ncbi:MAG: hypothetical protein FJ313_07665, partial [Gemmatimonadetes bacterium]|nr:hypothetical protein [Gemmatimonadota bacterium]